MSGDCKKVITIRSGESLRGVMIGGRLVAEKYFGMPSLDMFPMWLPGSTLGVTMAVRGGQIDFISLSMAWNWTSSAWH